MEYRKATIEDLEELMVLRDLLLIDSNEDNYFEKREAIEQINREYFRKGFESGEFIVWIAEEDDKIVATSGITLVKIPATFMCQNGHFGYITNIYTLPEYRRRGLGKELVLRLIASAKELGYYKIMLGSTKAGRPLYEHLGFVDAEDEMVLFVDPQA